MTMDALTYGPAGGMRFSRSTGRSLTSDALGAIRYPSPFFDIAHTYLPSSFKTMLKWCRYYYLTNPIINAVCTKMAEYPVTDLVFDTENASLQKQWEYCFGTILNFKKFEVEAGLDYNCFHGDVKAVTRDGVFRLRDLVGKTVDVLSEGGVYRPATFKSFGVQELLEVEFSDGSTVLATPEHEWPVINQYGKTVRRTTQDLPVGDRNYALLRSVAPRPEKNADFYEGIRHGFVFGDGTLYNEGKQARAYFCGVKDKEMLKYFEGVGGSPREDSRGVVMIHGLPPSWKKLPDTSASPSYWYGFVCGFLAADGSVDVNGCVVLTQGAQSTLEVIKDQLPRLGIAAGKVRGYEPGASCYENSSKIFALSLLKQFMQPEDFLLARHRENFVTNFKPTKYSTYAHVTAVRETGLVDEVFCCVEPETHTFTLSNGVLTGNCYGNAFISLAFPFQKLLICKHCGHTSRIEKQKYVFREYKFVGECQRCRQHQEFKVRDHYIRSIRDIRLIRWNPEYITIQHNEATGESRYYYTIPPSLSNDVRMGKRHIIERIPQVFMEALRKNKALLFSRDNIYHMKRPTIAQKDKGWGMPMILPVLKDTFYLQVLRKAQEAIAVEHIVPLRLLFPQTATGESVYSTVNLTQWRNKIEQEILRWRMDNNYIPLLPIPVGQQTLGGDGRALMLAQEYRVWLEHIIAGMGVPIEFVYGGMQYCQDLNTYVFTDKGMVQLKDLVPKTSKETSLGEGIIATGRSIQTIGGAHNTGMKKAAKLRTRLGLDAIPSHDHRYQVLTPELELVWKKVRDLKPGDKLAVQAGMNVWPKETPNLPYQSNNVYERNVSKRYPVEVPSRLDPPLARILGYLVSEGCALEESNRIGFSQADVSVMNDFLVCSEGVFKYKTGLWESNGVYHTEISRKPAVLFLHKLGIVGYAHEKEVPECIRSAPKDIVRNFLMAYFEGDGSVSTINGKQMVSCGSKSEELLKQIQLLLLNFGVVASRYYDECREIWQLQIRSKYVDVYAQEIGFISERKKTKLSLRSSAAKTHVGERIPYLKEVLDEFRATHFDGRSSWEFEKVGLELKQEEYTVRDVAKLLDRDVTTIHYHIKEGHLVSHRRLPGEAGRFGPALIHRNDLKVFLENFGVGRRKSVPGRSNCGMTYSKLSTSDLQTIQKKDPELAHRISVLAESHYVWDEVIDIELFDFEIPMGDLTVEVDHSYIANGLVTHNSGSNVSMRILENHFLDQKTQRKQLVVDFIMPNVAAYMGWETCPVHYKRFKMADDLQRSALYLQMNQAGKLSDKSLLEDMDWDARKEAELIATEQKRVLENQRTQALAQSSIQGEAQLVQIKYQTRAQKMMMQAQAQPMPQQDAQALQQGGMMAAGQPGVASPNAVGAAGNAQTAMMNQAGQVPPMQLADGQAQGQQGAATAEGESPLVSSQPASMNVLEVANQVVSWLNQLPEHQKQAQLVQMQKSNPQLYSLVLQLLQSSKGANSNSAAMPMPEQKPPMRGPEAAQI